MSKTLTLRGPNRIARNISFSTIVSCSRSESGGLVDDDHVVSSFFNRPTGEQFLEENTNRREDYIEEQFRDLLELQENNNKKSTKTTRMRATNSGHRKAEMDRYIIGNSLFEQIYILLTLYSIIYINALLNIKSTLIDNSSLFSFASMQCSKKKVNHV